MISRTWHQSARPIVAQGDEVIIIIWLALISVGACTPNNGSKPDRASAVSSVYAPRTREVTITTVPLLVKEEVEGDTVHFTFINPEDDVHSFVLPDLVVPLPPQKITTTTRSMLQTDQRFPSTGSQKEGLVVNPDTSVDIYFGPEAPAGKEANWVQTIPGKGWFVVLRLYGPLEPWFDKTWRPGEMERIW